MWKLIFSAIYELLLGTVGLVIVFLCVCLGLLCINSPKYKHVSNGVIV